MAIGRFLKGRLLIFRRQAVVLGYAVADPRTPAPLKLASVAAALYLLSPVDLVPFWVPFLGVVDDLVIVPLAVSAISRRLPAEVRADAGLKADHWIRRYFRRPLLTLAVLLAGILLLWVALLYLLFRALAG